MLLSEKVNLWRLYGSIESAKEAPALTEEEISDIK